MDAITARFEEITGLTDSGYDRWKPGEALKNLQKYNLIVFDWDAVFDKKSNRMLPGVFDSLYIIKHFFSERREDHLAMCLVRDAPKVPTGENVRSDPTDVEKACLRKLVEFGGATNEPILCKRDVCFAVSRQTRRPSPAPLLHFMHLWSPDSLKLDYTDGVFPPSYTLYVGAAWSSYAASIRANADFVWASRFFGGLSGNDYWTMRMSHIDFCKDWFVRENSCPFSLEQRATVQICWDNLAYDPTVSGSTDDVTKYDFVLNMVSTARDMKQQILVNFGYKTVIGIGQMQLFYVNQSNRWEPWPEDSVFEDFGASDWVHNLHLSTSKEFLPDIPKESIVKQKQEEQQHLLDEIKEGLTGSWEMPAEDSADTVLKRTETDPSVALEKGFADSHAQRESLFHLLRVGILAFRMVETDHDLDRVRIYVESDHPPDAKGDLDDNINALRVKEVVKNRDHVALDVAQYGIGLFSGPDKMFKVYTKDCYFRSLDRTQTLFCFDLIYGRVNNKLSFGFVHANKRDLALRALYFYFSQSPVLQPAYGKFYDQQFVANLDKQHEKRTRNAAEFIKTYESGENEQFASLARNAVDEYDLSRMSSVKSLLQQVAQEKPSKHLNFGKVLRADSDVEQKEAEPVPKKKETNTVIVYKDEPDEPAEEDKESEEDKIQKCTTLLTKGFSAAKHKRGEGKKITEKYFWVNFDHRVLYWADKKPKTYNASSGKGIGIGQVTKIVQGQEFNPKIEWKETRKKCMTIAGFFQGCTLDLEFDNKKNCSKIYHALHFILFRNNDDDIRDNLIFKEENKMSSLVHYISRNTREAIDERVYARLDHGAISVYQIDKHSKPTGSPIHVYEVSHDTKVVPVPGSKSEFELLFQNGDLLHDEEFLNPQKVTFRAVDSKDIDSHAAALQWQGKIETIAKNLKIRFDTNQTIIQHGKNIFHDDPISPAAMKALGNHGTWFSRTFGKKQPGGPPKLRGSVSSPQM